MNQPTIAFIGGGNMATSIIGGLIESGYPATAIRVGEPLDEGRRSLQANFGVSASADNADVCRGASIVVLAVKPQVMQAVAGALASRIGADAVVVSIAAGIPVAALQKWLGGDTAVVRCMPNTPALIHRGVSGLFASDAVSGVQKDQVGAIFEAVGIVTWLEREEEIDAITALSGSGPAYFFLMIEAMEKAGIELGLAPDTARRLSLHTALGAATMASESDADCAELRRRVSSPGGTTERAIATFMAGEFPQLVARAMGAASERAREMAEEFSR